MEAIAPLNELNVRLDVLVYEYDAPHFNYGYGWIRQGVVGQSKEIFCLHCGMKFL